MLLAAAATLLHLIPRPLRVENVPCASREQSVSVAQINKAMVQVDQVTQRNAAAAEELASTAEELAAQAEALTEMMSFFRLQRDDERPSAKPSARTTLPRAE